MITEKDMPAGNENLFPGGNDFANLYVALRKNENRIYTDDEVAKLPFIAGGHVHEKEWAIRKNSSEKLYHYLAGKKSALNLLEVGCGNGWLCAKLSVLPGASITGTDINLEELEQARAVFGQEENIVFIQEDFRSSYFDDQKFDIILFAASVQYFFSFEEIMNRALLMLNNGGEVHIIDSLFYAATEMEAARNRTACYYRSKGFDSMTDMYFHHDADALKDFKHRFLYNPKTFVNRIFNRQSIFPWIRITP